MTAKVPYPRQLTATETLDTLTHWKSHVRNYFRRDESLKLFFARGKTWRQGQDNYGFTGEHAAAEADQLEGLLDTIAGFMPGPYLTAKITKYTESMEGVFDVIWKHYDVDPSPSTFLDFAELKLSNEERYIDLFYRMQYHAEQHLLKSGTTVEGNVLTRDETLSHSHRNLISLNWIQSLEPNLLSIVKLEKHQDLKSGKQLHSMVQDIAKNVDEWLKRHGFKPPIRSQENAQVESTVRSVRYDGYGPPAPRGTGRGQYRGGYRGARGYSNNRSNNFRSRSAGGRTGGPNRFCPGCNYLAQELGLEVNYRHFPADCTRKKSVLRILRSAEQELDEDDQEEVDDYQEDDQELPPEDEGTDQSKLVHHISQSSSPLAHKVDQKIKPISAIKQSTLIDSECSEQQNSSSCINVVWKTKSPTVDLELQGHKVTAIIDEGSEISAINLSIVNAINIPICRTLEAAQSAGSQSLKIAGKSTHDIVVETIVNSSHVKWNLGQCLVIKDLGCDILIGEPAKEKNSIFTHPVYKYVVTNDTNSNKTVLSYNNPDNLFNEPVSEHKIKNVQRCGISTSVVRLNRSQNVYSNDSVSLEIPKEFRNHSEILIETSENSKFPGPGIFPIHHNMVKLENTTPQIQTLKENDIIIFSELKKPEKIRIEKGKDDISSRLTERGNSEFSCASRKIYNIEKNNMEQFIFPHISMHNDENVLKKVVLDPDNRLSNDYKVIFNDILVAHSDILTERPGRYNGAFGQVNCTLTLSGNPPPSSRPRVPNYSQEKLNIMADIMQQMEDWGVLVKPETIGVVPTNIHPCILVPKEGGKFRLVTDFRSIQSHIKQLPTVMPTISDAMTALSSADYHIELDFSNFYWQNSIPREDSEKLAVYHPYGGLRVYTVCPQGLRNSAEWGSEILARIYGDLVQQKKCTRIADQIYVLGNSLEELVDNFKVVLHRARQSNLTFKPSKVVICPETTIILGWKKKGKQWFPTEHVLSPLAQAEPPSTVKKMRGWLGAYRQIAKTIPQHATVLKSFEKMVGGKNSRDKIVWTPDLLAEFDSAKKSVETSSPITIPRSTDKLKIYPDWSQDADAVGGRLVIERLENGKKINLNGGEFSCRLKGAQSRWTPCEKECLGIKLLVQHYQPYIRESTESATIYTDNIVSVHAWNAIKLGKISSSSRVASFISTMCENKIEIVHLPGESTKVADYNSRFPVTCTNAKCQTCKFVQQEITFHENYVRYTQQGCDDNVMLVERPSWLALQHQDKTLTDLRYLIINGLAPEKKSRDKDLKLLHNMYKRGTLFIAKDGLIQAKQPDVAHSVEYEPIVIPAVYIASVIQSLHLKLNHPSPYQLHKNMARHFFTIGMAKSINNIAASCDTCSRLKILPKQVHKSSTEKNDTFGTRFSADILIEKGQHILLCREKLSQFTTTCFVSDESQQCIEQGIISSIIDLIPDGGAVIQVDAGPGLVALGNNNQSSLSSLNIKLDIGRIHNKQKNPIAENAIKEFRKEWLRLKPNGSTLSDLDRAKITAIMNKRIRLNGLAPKEFVLKRSMNNHAPISVDDGFEGDVQYSRRSEANSSQYLRDSVKKKIPVETSLKVGDLVYIIADLSKSRAREQFIVTKCFRKQNQTWIIVRKSQKSLRNKEYLLKASEVFLAPVQEQLWNVEVEEDDDEFQGFQENITLSKRDRLREIIKSMENSTSDQKKRGRPKRTMYPDYVHSLPTDVRVTEEDEMCCGFPSDEQRSIVSKRDSLQKIIQELEDENDNDFYGFTETEVDSAVEKNRRMEEILSETEDIIAKLRCVKSKKKKCQLHSWIYEEWLDILDEDLFEEKKPLRVQNIVEHNFVQGENDLIHQHIRDNIMLRDLNEHMHLDSDDSETLEYDYSDVFHSLTDHEITQSADLMVDEKVTTIDNFNVFYDKHKPSMSTPRKELFSVTDPLLLDKILIVSSSESEYEEEDDHFVIDDANVPSTYADLLQIPGGPVRLEKKLDRVHELCPELTTPETGKVYNMSTVLENIQVYDDKQSSKETETDLNNELAATTTLVEREHRPKRTLERLDYKLLNTKGAAYSKKN